MANINQYKSIIKEMEERIDLLNKAIEMDPQETIAYQSAIQHCEQQLEAARTIVMADTIVNKKDDTTNVANDEKPKKATKKKVEPKPVEEPKVEPAPAVEEEQTDIFDMFGD